MESGVEYIKRVGAEIGKTGGGGNLSTEELNRIGNCIHGMCNQSNVRQIQKDRRKITVTVAPQQRSLISNDRRNKSLFQKGFLAIALIGLVIAIVR